MQRRRMILLKDKAAANARGERTLSDRLFAFGEVSYLRDPFKDIDYFIAPVVGAGYRVIKSETRSLTVDGAVGIQTESNSTLGRTSSGAIKAGENLDWELSASSKLTQKITGIWKTDDFGDALYHFDAGLVTTVARSRKATARCSRRCCSSSDRWALPQVASVRVARACSPTYSPLAITSARRRWSTLAFAGLSVMARRNSRAARSKASVAAAFSAARST